MKITSSSDSFVKLYLEYEPYERYGGGGMRIKKATISGSNLFEALCKLVDNLLCYLDTEEIEDEGYNEKDIVDKLYESNGDGCDFIIYLENKTTGDVLIDCRDWIEDEEEW